VPPERNNTSESTAASKTLELLFNNLKIERNIVQVKRYGSEKNINNGA